MSQPTILHLTSMECTKYGAIEHLLLEIARACTARGVHSVFQYEALPLSDAFLRDLADAGAEVVVRRLLGNPARGAAAALALMRARRPEIVHAHFLSGYLLAALPWLARLAGGPRVIHMVHCNPTRMSALRKRLSYGQYDRVLAVSEAVGRNLLEGGVDPDRVTTHYYGLFGTRERSAEQRSYWRRKLGVPDGAPVLANIAFEAHFKGLDILLESLRQAREAHPDLHLLQVGVEPRSSQLPTLARRLGLASHVHWAGILDEGWQLLNAADFYVQSSRDQEGLPLAILEAMALGLPVVGTRVAGIPEEVIDGATGTLVEPGDPAALAAAIKAMVRERARWSVLGDAGRERYRELFRGEESVRRMVEEHYGL